MRNEVEQAYQRGGLAYFQGGGDVEAPAIDPAAIVERTTNPQAGLTLTEMILQQSGDYRRAAMDRLRVGRENLAERQAQQAEADERAKWLALSQAMLTPTRTGGFGESVGMAAGAIRDVEQERLDAEKAFAAEETALAAQEYAANSDYVDQMIDLAGEMSGTSAKTIHGAIQTMVKPGDENKPFAQQSIIFGSMQQQPNGDWEMVALKDKDGNHFEAASPLDPARAAALVHAEETASALSGRQQEMITSAYALKHPVINVRRSLELLESAGPELTTSGFNAMKTSVGQWLGADFGDTTELSELGIRMGDQLFENMAELKGSTSDKDVQLIKGLSVGLGTDTTTNYTILKEMEQIYTAALQRGIRESWQTGDMDGVADLWESVADNRWVRGAQPIDALTQEAVDEVEPGTYFFLRGDWGGEVYFKPPRSE